MYYLHIYSIINKSLLRFYHMCFHYVYTWLYVYSTLCIPYYGMFLMHVCFFYIYVSSIYFFLHMYILFIYMPFSYICSFFVYFSLYLYFFKYISLLCEFFNIFWLSRNKKSYKKSLCTAGIRMKIFWEYNVGVS